MSADELRTFFDRSGLLVKGKLDIVSARRRSPPPRSSGARAFTQNGRIRQRRAHASTPRVYAGRAVVAIYCQRKERAPQVCRPARRIRQQIHIARL